VGNDASEFYDGFADKYDVMVSDERYGKVLPFFTRIFGKNHVRSVLDCSCGTGKHVLRLSKAGYEVVGSDFSKEMIRKARQNSKALGTDADFVQADFKELSKAFERNFDCVICWGNSLGHELEERGVLSALRSMRSVLTEGGVLLVQIRNLPKWVTEGRRILPVHYHREPNGDRKVFIYFVDFYRTRARFNVVSLLEFEGKPRFEVDSVSYRIISAKRLKGMALQAGFRNLEVYGNIELARFDNRRSEDIIVVGRK
jgi:SAM-dependent methyltransferase